MAPPECCATSVIIAAPILKTKKGIFSVKRERLLLRDLCHREKGYQSNKSRVRGSVTAMGFDISAMRKKQRLATYPPLCLFPCNGER